MPPGYDISWILIGYFALLFSLSVHEAAHAATADRWGDPTARLLGRVTLNPLAHIDPLGTVILPLLMMIGRFGVLFGWAKPVPFNPRNLRDMRRGPMYIAIAGPSSNVLMAVFFIFLARFSDILVQWAGLSGLPMLFRELLVALIGVNLVLAFFNLIPVPPLDGHHILYYFLPEGGQRVLEQIGPFGIIIAIMVFRPIWVFLIIPVLQVVLGFAGLV